MAYGGLVAFFSHPFGFLATPVQLAQQPPDMARMVADAGLLGNQIGDARKGPELIVIALLLGACQQRLNQVLKLLLAEPTAGSGRLGLQAGQALILEALSPGADTRATDAQASADFSIREPLFEENGRLLAAGSELFAC